MSTIRDLIGIVVGAGLIVSGVGWLWGIPAGMIAAGAMIVVGIFLYEWAAEHGNISDDS